MSELATSTTSQTPDNGLSATPLPSRPASTDHVAAGSFDDAFQHIDITDINYSHIDECPEIPFFDGGERRAVLDEVAHLCQFSHNLVAVLGAAGSGKTALAYQAAKELSESADCCVMEASLMNNPENMLLLLSQHLGIFIDDGAGIEQIVDAILHYQPSGLHQSVVVIVDEAQHLQKPALDAFIQLLQNSSPNYFHILLMGDPALQLALDQLDKGGVLVYEIPLRPLTQGELSHYVDFKLSLIAYQGAELFDDEVMDHLWRETQGLPKLINQVANKVLLSNQVMTSDDQRIGLPMGYMAMIVLLLAALILAVFYIDDEPVAETITPPVIEPAQQIQDGGVSLGGTETNEESRQSSNSVIDSTSQLVASSAPATDNAPSEEPPVSAEQVIDQPHTAVVGLEEDREASSFVVVGDDLGIDDQSDRDVLEESENTIVTEVPDLDAVVAADNTSLEESVDRADTPSVQAADPPSTVSSDPVPESTLTPDLSIDIVPSRSSGAAPSTATADESAVMTWPSTHYTLQVMGASRLTGVESFVNNQPNRDLLRVVALPRNGAAWYVVFTGVYETREEALSAINFLPPSQKNTRPWPRRISDIQQKISGFRRK